MSRLCRQKRRKRPHVIYKNGVRSVLFSSDLLFDNRLQNFRFFNLHFTFIQLAAIQTEDTDEEIVVCLALVDTIIVTLLRQMHVGYLFLGTIHIIYILQIRILEVGTEAVQSPPSLTTNNGLGAKNAINSALHVP